MKHIKKIDTYLPIFSGFYGTWFGDTDAMEENELDHWSEETGKELKYEDINWNYKQYHEDISDACCDIIEEWLNEVFTGVKIKFQALISPQFYNFSNDSINCEITIDYVELLKYLSDNYEAFRDYIKDEYTSRSGFISSYSNDAEEWVNSLKYNEDHSHILGACLNFVLLNEEREEVELYTEVMDKGIYLQSEPLNS